MLGVAIRTMHKVIGVADMQMSIRKDDILSTHALGSCLGITLYDPVAVVGGLLHIMLPHSNLNTDKMHANPFMFVDTGVPIFFRRAYSAGAKKERLIVKVAGGATHIKSESDIFSIGKRNLIMLRRMFWENGIIIDAQDVGGKIHRTMILEMESGRTLLRNGKREWELL